MGSGCVRQALGNQSAYGGSLVLLSVCMAAFSFSQAARADEGLTGPPDRTRYPREAFLLGDGSGLTLAVARDSARAEIARYFEVRIDSSYESLTRTIILVKNNVETSHASEDVQTRTLSETKVVLEGVEIVATWKSEGQIHALAVLDRGMAAQRLVEGIKTMDRDIQGLLESARALPGSVELIRKVNRAIFLFAVRRIQQQKLALIQASAVPPLPISQTDLLLELDHAFKASPIMVKMTGDEGGRIRAAVESEFTRKGFRVTQSDYDAVIRIRGQWATEVLVSTDERFRYVSWSLRLQATDLEKASVDLAVLEERGREGHKTVPGAIQRSEAAACARISDKIGLVQKIMLAIVAMPGE